MSKFEILRISEALENEPMLTDEGVAIKRSGTELWYLCDWEGNIPSDCEEGDSISEVDPSIFINASYDEFFTDDAPRNIGAADALKEMVFSNCPSLEKLSGVKSHD